MSFIKILGSWGDYHNWYKITIRQKHKNNQKETSKIFLADLFIFLSIFNSMVAAQMFYNYEARTLDIKKLFILLLVTVSVSS